MSLFKEPLFHFFLLGLAIFGWFSYLNPSSIAPERDDQIIIDAQDIDRLIGQFRSTWQRPPSQEELTALQDALLRQEVLVREARALGLDRGDSIVRNRLAQKMEFLTLSLAQAAEPDDAILRGYLNEHSDRFMQPGRVAFQQIGLGPEQEPAKTADILAAVKGGADPAQFAAARLLPTALPLSTEQQVDAQLGRGFYARLDDLPMGEWLGPIPSGFGFHLVRIEAREPALLPAYEDIREEVLFDWRRSLTSDLSEAQFDALKAEYDIITPSAEEIAQRLEQQ